MKISRILIESESGDGKPVVNEITVKPSDQNWSVWHRDQDGVDLLTLEVQIADMRRTVTP